MDWEKIILYGVIGLVVSFMMSYMNKGASQKIEENENGEIELQMNKLYQIIAYISIAIAIVFIIAAVYYQDNEIYLVSGLMLLLFGGLGVLVLMYYRNHKLKFGEERLVVQNWKGQKTELKWTEINHVKFNPFSGYLKINSLTKSLTIHQHLIGLRSFIEKMEEKTKWKAAELNLPIKMNKKSE